MTQISNLKHANSPPAQTLGIVGASSRAAAHSALRAGFVPLAADRFADADLITSAGSFERVSDFPEGLVAALERLRPTAWLYTGGLDDRPEVVDRLATIAPLLGNDGDTLRNIRDPFQLSERLERTPAPLGAVRTLRQRPRAGSGWILKRSPHVAEGAYYQRWAVGQPASALFVGSPAGTRLLGATRQLVGEEWLHAAPMAWCGNVGPLALPQGVRSALEEVGSVLGACGLRGLFGIDFVWQRDNEEELRRLTTLEVNPRYTGSVEVLEHALGHPTLLWHAEACGHAPPEAPTPPATSRPGQTGKAIVYAPKSFDVRVDLTRRFARSPDELPKIADLPAPGTRIEEGHPIVSVFAEGVDEASCLESLRAAAQNALRLIAGESPVGSPRPGRP